MSVDDVWGVQTWHMNQSEVDTEPDSATKDKKSIMTKTQEKVKLLPGRQQRLSTQVNINVSLLELPILLFS